MTHLYATLHTLAVTLLERIDGPHGQNRERGASSIEIVFWSVGLLTMAGLVYAAIQAYISNKIPGIR